MPPAARFGGYLLRDAGGDIRNELARLRHLESKRKLDALSSAGGDVVDSARDWNTDVEAEALERVHPRILDWLPPGVQLDTVLEHARDLVNTAEDEQMLHLIIAAERGTEPYAAILDITSLPIQEQRSAVNAHKDRLKQRVRRLRNLLTS